MDEGFSHQQEPMLLLLAQKENRKGVGSWGGKRHRKDYPHFWKGGYALFPRK